MKKQEESIKKAQNTWPGLIGKAINAKLGENDIIKAKVQFFWEGKVLCTYESKWKSLQFKGFFFLTW